MFSNAVYLTTNHHQNSTEKLSKNVHIIIHEHFSLKNWYFVLKHHLTLF